MLNKNLAIAIAVVLACVCLAEARDESPHDMADALRMLQELDRYYTQAARPRMLLKLPYCSVSAMFAQAQTNDFYAIIRNRSASLMRRLSGSDNSTLKTFIDKLDAPLPRHWSKLHVVLASVEIDRRDVAVDRVDPHMIDRALRLLQLQTLDRIYSYHTRPRFGKRSDAFTNWGKDLEKPDIPAWLQYARRR